MDQLWAKTIERNGRLVAARDTVTLIRTASVEGWPGMIAAVEEALRLGTCDGGALLYIFREPDAAVRRRHQLALAAELAQLEWPMPEMDKHDQLLTWRIQ